MNLRPLHFSAALAALVLGLAGCGSGNDTAGSKPITPSTASAGTSISSSPAQQRVVITIKSFKFSGASSVKAGETITVKNEDSEAHTVTADSGDAFDVKVLPGKTATFTAPSAPGSYAYHCTYHANMHGSLTVS